MLLTQLNNQVTAFAKEVKLVHQFLEAQVKETPTALAIKDAEQVVTYHDLNCRANRLAHFLRSQGVGNDSLVGVCVDRSIDLIVAVLAVLKAGGAYLPLDSAYPSDRLAYMIKQAQVSVVITQSHVQAQLPLQEQQVVCLDTQGSEIAEYSFENPESVSTADSLGYVIYTSGSTGNPKGVALPHASLVNLIRWQVDNSAVTTGKTLQFTPISFDVSFQEIFSTLAAGGTLVMIKDETRRDPFSLLKILEQESVERLFLPFVALQYLAEAATRKGESTLHLKEVITAGEQLRITPALMQWFKQMPHCSLHNHYGPSESHVVTAYRLVGEPETWPLLPPIGKALPHAQIHLLDEHLKPVAAGEVGEIYIGGDCLAREYLHRPDLTAERFISNPRGVAAERLYKTGDLSRCLPGGTYEYLGRSDQQIKIRGYRIEPGEIEAALEQHPDVSEAVVIAREDRPGQKRLVGYAIAPTLTGQFASNPPTQEQSLRQFLQNRLPDYMVPSAIVCLEAFPLTPSGKVDRRNLPVPSQPGNRHFVAPKTILQKGLAQIWETVLGVDQVGLNDDFFELGGHSLLATQVITRIREDFNREVSFHQFFETSQLGALAAWLSTEPSAPELLKLEPLTHDEFPPLTWMQEPLWFLDQLMAKHPFYTVPEAFRLEGPLSVQALAKSLQTVVDRHEPLRTTFEVVEGKPVQVIHETVECPFSVVDLSSLSEADREREAQVQLVEAARKPFDLAKDVLLRATLFKLEETDYVLLLNLHHIVCDGWSVGVLMQEIERLYTAYERGASSPLSPLPVQYADFTLWHRQWISPDRCEQQLDYWQQQLGDGVLRLALPTDFPRPVMPTYAGGRQFLTLPDTLTQGLKNLSKESGTTLYMVLLAAFQTLLYCYSGQDDITVGSLLANRPRPELEALIGFFPNTVALRTDLSGVLSFREVLQRVREVTLGAYTHQDLPFAQIVQALHPNHHPGQNPFFDVLFNLQNTSVSGWQHPSLSLTHLNLDNKTAKFDLFLELTEVKTELNGYFEYSTDLFKTQTIAEMSDRFVALLRSVVANPDQPISPNTVPAAIAQIKSEHHLVPTVQATSRPRTSLEAKVAELWANILSVEQVRVEENFFDLGGHSLLATELLFSLQDAFAVELSLLNIFMAPTVAEQAKLICDRKAGNPLEQETLDLRAEVVLADDIYPDTDMKANVESPEAVLLTGGTGFLGAFLLHEILQQTQANVYCLVRSKNKISAGQRLQTTLQRYGLWRSDQAHRIIPVMGDLSKPLLALSPEQFQILAETVDIIYHNGAMVNFMYPYPVMKATNVAATEDILRLASRSKLKPVHFLSTQGVFSPIAYEADQVIREQDQPAGPKGLYGYTQSKWVAEKLIAIAQSRGIPTMVYRPAWIEGHSQTGMCNRSDFLRSLIKGCLQLGVAPDWSMPVDLVPVDYISKGIVHLSLHQEPGQVFNFANPQTILWNQLVDWMVAYGYCLRKMAYSDWLALVKAKIKPGSANALAPFLAFLTEPSPNSSRTVPETYFQTHELQFDIQNLQQGLADCVPPYPAVIDMLPTYFDYFISSGFLESPLKAPARAKAVPAM